MKLSFNFDGKLITGTAEPLERRCDGYEVDLVMPSGKKSQFRICMGETSEWETDDIANPDIVRAVGMEIDRFDDGFEGEELPPNNYYTRMAADGSLKDISPDGEFVHEPKVG